MKTGNSTIGKYYLDSKLSEQVFWGLVVFFLVLMLPVFCYIFIGSMFDGSQSRVSLNQQVRFHLIHKLFSRYMYR